ncbi:MAG: response regulator transcription factor [Chloroflexota bacterium]|nr:response regulator transcription factor [Chloroflexota bacterium]
MHRYDIRVLVVAGDQLTRAGLAAVIAGQSGCAVVGQLAGPEFSDSVPDLYSPDAVAWDLGWDSNSALGHFDRAQEIGLPTVVLAPDRAQAAAAWDAGALGALPRDVEGPSLAIALIAASQGLAVFDPALRPPAQPSPKEEHKPLAISGLTPRELEVLALLAEGLPNKSIASRLDISEHTVKFHVNAVLAKLDAQSRTEAAVRAARMGLITL